LIQYSVMGAKSGPRSSDTATRPARGPGEWRRAAQAAEEQSGAARTVSVAAGVAAVGDGEARHVGRAVGAREQDAVGRRGGGGGEEVLVCGDVGDAEGQREEGGRVHVDEEGVAVVVDWRVLEEVARVPVEPLRHLAVRRRVARVERWVGRHVEAARVICGEREGRGRERAERARARRHALPTSQVLLR
jgi:hypothetical protein